MYEAVDTSVKYCQHCVVAKMPQPKIRPSWTPFLASWPLEVVAVEFTTLEPDFLMVENMFWWWPMFLLSLTNHSRSETMAKVLLIEWFLRYWVLERLHSDQGRNLMVIGEHCKLYGVSEVKNFPILSTKKSQVWAIQSHFAKPVRLVAAREEEKMAWASARAGVCLQCNSSFFDGVFSSWFSVHRERLQEVHMRAKEYAKKKAEERADRHESVQWGVIKSKMQGHQRFMSCYV